MFNYILAIIPLLPAAFIATNIADHNAIRVCLVSFTLSLCCFLISNTLIPIVAQYTLTKGLCGKDLGKKGTDRESVDVPEALGIVSGTTYIMAAIAAQLIFAQTCQQQVVYNSALFSICFMVFLGFTDDTLDLKWRYKIILPTVASLPLLSTYSGSTALYLPPLLQPLLMTPSPTGNGLPFTMTLLGNLVSLIAVVDTEAHGAIVELGVLFKVFMGLLAVFCTNSINIYAGINGLECGQAYVIAASILAFKLLEASRGEAGDDQLFAIAMVCPFIGACLSLLRSNWFPARVFVGDTFCYFAGMTFAVLGIHGHFSKTLLLLFAPQVLNFLLSIPQLFKLLPCPRHRLPRVDPSTHLLNYSAFPCRPDQYQYLKVKPDSEECPNCTLICLVLRLTGPLRESTLCTTLLAIQVVTSLATFYLRYYVLE